MPELTCTVCKAHKANLRPRKSKLKTSLVLFLCNGCFEGQFEPRYLVILCARNKKGGGLESVRDYIRHHKYHGNDITAEELI